MERSDVKIEVARLHRFDGEGTLKAFVDINFGDMLIVKGVRVVSGKKGLFVSLPREKGKDGKWYETVSPLTDDLRQKLGEVVLEAYAV